MKGPFWFGPSGIFGSSSGGGPFWWIGTVGAKFVVPFWQTGSFPFFLFSRLRPRPFGWFTDRKVSFSFPRSSLTGQSGVTESYLINTALRAKIKQESRCFPQLLLVKTPKRQNYPFPLGPEFKCRLTFLSLFPGTFAGGGMGKGEQLQISSHWRYLSVLQRRLQGVLRVFRPQRSYLSSCGALSAC